VPSAEASRRNGRKGGRPKGSKDPHTLERELARKALQDRIVSEIGPLSDVYLARAKGVFVMIEITDAGPQRVHDPARITQLLSDRSKHNGKEFFFIEGTSPDAKILLDVIARLDGKPAERLELSGPNAGPLHVHHHFARA